jgi:signal peptidase I
MTPVQEANSKSPWMTIWLSPRQTIDDVLATRPRRLIWLLASLGMIAGFYGQLLAFGLTSQLLDWRFLLGFVIVSAAIGVAWLYLAALVYSWIGRLFGGRASPLELRAVLAWSTAPTILGLVVILVLFAALRGFDGENAAATGNIALLLPAIVAVFGFWSLVVLLLMLSRVEHFGFWRSLAVYVLALILPLTVAFLIRTFLFQPFDIPSRSMVPTLLDGDHFFVSKYSYGYTHYSLPFSPRLFSGRIFGSEPARGDVVVFRLPKDQTTDFVKRVVGLPGDRIQMKQGLLYINDTPVTRERLPDFVDADPCGAGPTANVKRWRETLSNGVNYETLDCIDNGFLDNTSVYVVPGGHFFTLGDNRDNSTDSRMLSAIGYVPLENMIGRVGVIYFSRALGSGSAAAVRSGRFGLMVR